MKRDKLFPRNCPVQEHDGDGRPVGRCWRYLTGPLNTRCQRHGRLIFDGEEGTAAVSRIRLARLNASATSSTSRRSALRGARREMFRASIAHAIARLWCRIVGHRPTVRMWATHCGRCWALLSEGPAQIKISVTTKGTPR